MATVTTHIPTPASWIPVDQPALVFDDIRVPCADHPHTVYSVAFQTDPAGAYPAVRFCPQCLLAHLRLVIPSHQQ